MLLFYNIINHNFVPDINFEMYDSGYSLRNENEYMVPFPRTNVLKMHFNYRMPLIWNNIPSIIRQSETALKFKDSYKCFLLNES